MATAIRPGSPGLGTTNTTAALRIEGTRTLLDAVMDAGVRRIVQQSIALAYVDGGDTWLAESTPFYRADPTAVPPHEQMEAMVRVASNGKLEWMILRGGTFVGADTFQDDAIRQLRAGELRLAGDGMNWLSPVRHEDYAEAVALAIHGPEAAWTLNVTAEPIRQGAYLDELADRLGAARPERDRDQPRPRSYRCTSAAAERVLGWRPTHELWPDA